MVIMKRWLPSVWTAGLARETAHVGFWQVVRVGGQALWIILIARLLGPHGYGAFAGAAGLATAVGGLAGVGMGLVMLQDVARTPSLFDDRWRKAVVACLASGSALIILFTGLAPLVVGGSVSRLALLAIAVSELLLFPFISIAAFAFSARNRVGTAAALPALMASFRVLAAVVFWVAASTRTLDVYIWFHAAATLLCAGGAWLLVHWQLRPRPVPFRLARRDLGEGFGFSLMWLVGNALNSLDKTLVLRLAGAEVAGLYTATYRFAAVLALPVEALTMAAGPRLFRHGDGSHKQPQLIRRLLLIALCYGLVAAGAVWAMAGALPWLLGPRFEPAVTAARWMALFVPCYSLRLLGSNVLMASNCKTLRTIIEVCGLGMLIAFALLWLSHYGLEGAVMMICGTEALLALASWSAIWWRGIQQRPSAP